MKILSLISALILSVSLYATEQSNETMQLDYCGINTLEAMFPVEDDIAFVETVCLGNVYVDGEIAYGAVRVTYTGNDVQTYKIEDMEVEENTMTLTVKTVKEGSVETYNLLVTLDAYSNPTSIFGRLDKGLSFDAEMAPLYY